ncbi:bifunctional UDP-N-acetylglucosamine diphosphorylase/glucosamine-1-phosphate N-acetyltransferase GlmU [Desulfobaculum sp.]
MSQRTVNAGALVLAAGKGTRMRSNTPKVLHTILGEPMLWYVHSALSTLPLSGLWTVIGHGAGDVRAAFSHLGEDAFIVQEQQLGTGHAVQEAWDAITGAGLDAVLVANGDTPLIPAASLRALMDESIAQNADIAFLTLTLDDPGAYGRVTRGADGTVAAIIEAKDFRPEDHGGEVHEINAGIYWLNTATIGPLLSRLTNKNASGEFYITDLVALAVAEGLTVQGINGGSDPHLLGVNSPAELVRSEELLRKRIVDGLLDEGVLIRRPDAVTIGPRASVAPGSEICGPCEILGESTIAAGASVASNVWMHDSHIGEDSSVLPFSHLEQATVQARCHIGPYARLRPGALVCDEAKVGNFVEMKKATLGPGSKASHLTYLGDTEVGTGANIGAGTITCNYDGVNKFKTVIEDDAFIGSNTALVAPVTIGKGALVGAGSVITRNVKENTIGITRAKQRELPRRK